MKKYRVTDKHPTFKEGCIIKQNSILTTYDGPNVQVFSLLVDNVFIEHVLDVCIVENIENGWIEEIKEPNFTKDDMIEFSHFAKSK